MAPELSPATRYRIVSFLASAIYIALLYAGLIVLTYLTFSWLGFLFAPLLGSLVLGMTAHYLARAAGGWMGWFLLAPSAVIATLGFRRLAEAHLPFAGDWNPLWSLLWFLFLLPPFIKPILQPSHRWLGPLSLHGVVVVLLHTTVAAVSLYEGWQALQDPMSLVWRRRVPIAIEAEDLDALRDLHDRGVLGESYGAIAIAVRDGKARVARQLIDWGYLDGLGSDVYAHLLELSIEHEDMTLLELLLESDVPSDALARGLRTAVVENKPRHLEALLDGGAPVETGERKPVLTTAVSMHRVEAVALLLEHGANPDTPNEEGRTALQLALFARPAHEQDVDTIRLVGLLLSAGADSERPHSEWNTSLRKLWSDRLASILRKTFGATSVDDVDADFASFLETATTLELMGSPLRNEPHPTLQVVCRIHVLLSRHAP